MGTNMCAGLADGTGCDDGDATTGYDVCQGGVCVGVGEFFLSGKKRKLPPPHHPFSRSRNSARLLVQRHHWLLLNIRGRGLWSDYSSQADGVGLKC